MSVDLWTVILTIASFFLLYFLLNTFLFKPLLKFMDDRKARIDAGLEEGKKAKQAMEESQRTLESEIRGTGTRARQILAESKSSDDSARAKVIEEARGGAAAAALTARQRVAEEEKNAAGDVENRMPELVAALTGRLLGDEEIVAANLPVIEKCAAAAKAEKQSI